MHVFEMISLVLNYECAIEAFPFAFRTKYHIHMGIQLTRCYFCPYKLFKIRCHVRVKWFINVHWLKTYLIEVCSALKVSTYSTKSHDLALIIRWLSTESKNGRTTRTVIAQLLCSCYQLVTFSIRNWISKFNVASLAVHYYNMTTT